MADRFVYAIQSLQTTSLVDLARLLASSVQEVLDTPGLPGPHRDPAVRLICHQIAFAGNGDLTRKSGYFEELYNYCLYRAQYAPNADFPQEKKDEQQPPLCETQ